MTTEKDKNGDFKIEDKSFKLISRWPFSMGRTYIQIHDPESVADQTPSHQPVPLNSLQILPEEILDIIFIHAKNPSLSRACRIFYKISKSPITRARWLIYTYGKQDALARCWLWGFMKKRNTTFELETMRTSIDLKRASPFYQRFDWRYKNVNENTDEDSPTWIEGSVTTTKCRCYDIVTQIPNVPESNRRCGKSWKWWWDILTGGYLNAVHLHNKSWRRRCAIEDAQMDIVCLLIEMGANTRAGGDMALRECAKWGHLDLVELLLCNGANPNAVVSFGQQNRWYFSRRREIGGGIFIDDVAPSHQQSQEQQPRQVQAHQQRQEPQPQQGHEQGQRLTQGQGHAQEPMQRQGQVQGPMQRQGQVQGPMQMQGQGQEQRPAQGQGQVQRGAQERAGQAHQQLDGEPQNLLSFQRMLQFLGMYREHRSEVSNNVSLLLQAVRANHIRLAEILIEPHTITPKHNRSLAYNPLQSYENLDVLTDEESEVVGLRISAETMKIALHEAFKNCQYEMCKLLIKGGGITSTNMIQELILKAGTARVLLGIRERYTQLILLGIHHMTNNDFESMSASIVRSSAEVGSVDTMKACRRRGADVNVWDGFPLYACVYNGNLKVTRYLLTDEGGANTDYFGFKQILFCTGLIFMELFSIVMFLILLAIWIGVLLQTFANMAIFPDSSDPYAYMQLSSIGPTPDNILTVQILSGVTFHSLIALLVMQRLVPFYQLCGAFIAVLIEKIKRQRERSIRNLETDQERLMQ